MRNSLSGNKKITVAGAGYVGLSLALLLSRNNPVTCVMTKPSKAQMINSGDAVLVDNDKLYLTNLLNCEKVCAGFVKKCLKNHYRLYDEKKVNGALDESERRNGISYELRQKNAVHNALKNKVKTKYPT